MNSILSHNSLTLALTGVLIAFNLNTGLAYARSNNGRPQGGADRPRKHLLPVKESPNGETITGTCRQDRNGDKLLLIPDDAPKGEGRAEGPRETTKRKVLI